MKGIAGIENRSEQSRRNSRSQGPAVGGSEACSSTCEGARALKGTKVGKEAGRGGEEG